MDRGECDGGLAKDSRGDCRGEDRGDPRGEARGDARGETRGEARGDTRGDTLEDDFRGGGDPLLGLGDTRPLLRGEIMAFRLWLMAGAVGCASGRGEIMEDADGDGRSLDRSPGTLSNAPAALAPPKAESPLLTLVETAR